MPALGQAVGSQGIADQHHLPGRQPLQQHRHRRGHMDPIGDQPQGHITPQGRRRDRSWVPVAQARHGVEGMGQHRHTGVVGRHGLGVVGFAVAQADDNALLPQGLDHRSGPRKFGRQRDHGDVGGDVGGCRRAAKTVDAFAQGRQRWGAQMRLGMGAAAGRRQEGALQVGPQQAAAPRLVVGPGLAQHRQCLPQGGHGAGHQGGTDGLHPIAPEKLQQLLQPGLVGGAEFGEGQPQAAIDLQIDPHRAQPVPVPVLAGSGAARRQRFDLLHPVIPVEADAPAALPLGALPRGAAGRGLGQAHVAQPAHRRWGDGDLILVAGSPEACCPRIGGRGGRMGRNALPPWSLPPPTLRPPVPAAVRQRRWRW